VSSPPEVKVKDKHRSSEKSKHSKERDGSKISKDSHKDHHRREGESQEKDPRERDKEKSKREHKDRDGKKDVLKHKTFTSAADSPNPLAQKSHSSEKKDKHGSKTSIDSVKKEIKQDSRKVEQKLDPSKLKKSENGHVRKERKEEKISSSGKSNSQKVDKKVESIKSSSKIADPSKRLSLSPPQTAPPKKKSKVEDLFSSSDDDSSEDEDEDFVKAIIEGVERNIDTSESSESSSDSELDDAVLNAWSSPIVSKLSPLSQKVTTKSPSSVKNSSSHKTARSFSPASEKSWSSKYSPTGSTHSHTSTSHKQSLASVSAKEKDISKHSKESKPHKSSTKSSHSSSDKKKESSHRSEKHASKRSSTPNTNVSSTPNTNVSTEKVDKHAKSHSKEKVKPPKTSHDKKPKDVKLITDLKSEKIDSVPHSLEKTEWKENFYKSENSKENVKNIKLEKGRTFSTESNEQHFLKKEYLSDDDDIDKKGNVTETFNFENGYEHLGIAPNGEDLIELLKLHRKLESMQDTSIIQRVVQEIEKTGLYKISDETFDFDLCELDSSTVKKIHNFLCSV
jgi:YEATS domain-containing protein 1/3